jgi:hypothetical protein
MDKYLFLDKHPTFERREGGRGRMADPELQGDEQILIRTQAVHVKSISFEAILTNKRIILVDRLKNLLPPKEIPLATIQSIESGENAIRDLIITLGVITKAGGARQMVLTFSREGGGNRVKERDEWVRQIRAYLTPSFEQVIRKVIPGMEAQSTGQDTAAPHGIRTPVPPSPEFLQPAKKTGENPPETWQPPAPAPEPAAESILGTYCTRCGTKVPEGSGFCNKCGTRITPAGEIPQVPVSAPASSTPVFMAPKERPIAIPRDTPHETRPLKEVSQSIPSAPVSPKPIVPEQKTAAVAHPAVQSGKKRFMPKLFSPKDLQPTPLVPSSMPTAVPPPPKKPSNKKKILLAAGIIVIILIAAVAVLVVLPKMGFLGSHSSSGSAIVTATTTSIPVATQASGSSSGTPVVMATPTPPGIPATGVAVSVSYIGGFTGSYSNSGVTTNETSSGAQMYPIANATGLVTAVFQKTDDTSTHALTVSIYKNGNQLASNSTSASYGKVTVTSTV